MDTKLTPSGATEPASNSSPQQGQQPSAVPEQNATPTTGAINPSASLTRPQSHVAEAMNRALDQRQEQQLYSSTWSGVLHVLTTVIPTPARNDRQRVQELIQTLELLAEEQKKKHKSFDPREPIFFNQLAAVIGLDRADAFITKTQKLASDRNDPAAAAKLMRDIAELIEGTALGANFGVDAATVERELGKEFSKRASRGVFLSDSILDARSNAPYSPEGSASFVVGEDLVESVKRDPSSAISYLQTPAGLAICRERIGRQKAPEAIVRTLNELRDSLGAERFSTLIAAYDSHFGRPLAADLVRRFEPSLEIQRSMLSRLCGTGATLFTVPELTRVADFMRAEHALVAETITVENERARLSLVSLEAQRAQIMERLAKFLGDETITSLPIADQEKVIQRKIAERFPGTREMGLAQMRKELETLASHKELNEFREHMKRLGRAPVGDLTGADYQGKTQEEIQALNTQRQQEIQAETQKIKGEALLISAQVEELSRTKESIETARASAERGTAGEREALEARYGALLRGVFPEISPEQNVALRAAARANLETLDERIQRANGPEREALCRERDSIEWASVQARVEHHLTTKPPNSTRALELLTEFQLRPGTGDVGRGEAFLQAARRLSGSIQAVETYVGEARARGQRELIERSAAKASARAKLDELEPEWRQARDQKDSYTFSGSDHWNNIYKELGQLRARKEFDVSVPVGRIEHLENTIANAGTFDRTGGSGYGDVAVRFHMLEERWQLTNQRMDRAAEQIPKLEQIATRMLDDRREQLLASIVAPRLRWGDVVDQAGLERALADQGAPSQGFESARQAYGVMMTALGDSDATVHASSLAPRGVMLSAGRSLLPSADKLPDELARVTGAKDLNEVALKLHTTLRHDHTLRPPREALTKLLECVGSDSQIGKQIIALRSAGRTDEIMSQLYARLSQDDAARVRLFMLSYDCPEIYRFFGVPDQSAGAMKQPSDVWKFVSGLPPAEQSPDILQLISIMPQLRARRDIEALVSKVPDEQLSAVLDRYQALSGQSLGAVMLELAPRAGDARRKFLVECVAPSRVMRESDLAPLYSRGAVPVGAQARQERMRELVSEDRRQSIELDKALVALIGSQAQERASLQAALPAMTQLQRNEKVMAIRQRLANLDAEFVAKRDTFLQRYDPALVARTGVRNNVEEARGMATQAALIEVSDPYGHLAQRAAVLVDLLSDQTLKPEDLVDTALNEVRKGNFSEGQTALLETFYLQQVAARTGTPLTGDLERDLRARQGGASLSPEHLRLVLRGGEALVQYDLARFTEGIRTRNPRMTVQAMIAMKAREGGQELFERSLRANREVGEAWASFKASPEGKEVAAYYDAVVTNDTVKQGVVELKQGFGTAARRTGEFFGDVRRVTGNFTERQMREAREFYKTTYGTDLVDDLKNTVPSLKEAWAGVMSVVPSERAAAAVAAVRSSISSTGIDFSIVQNALDLAPTPEQRRMIFSELNKFAQGLPNSWNYVDGRPMSVIEYVRSNGGPMGKADAAMLERLLGANDTRTLSERELSCYLGERRRLEFQIKQLDSLETRRLETHKHAQDFFTTVANMHSAAERDRDNRTVTWKRANHLVQVHAGMRGNQLDLLNHQRMGLADIASTRELVRLRGEMLLTDIITGEDRGLRVEQNDRSVNALRTRDAEREWVAVRRDVVNKWRYDAEVAQKSLESLDWWVNVGYQSVKAIAIVGVSVFGSPMAGFALACAWNLAEKAYKVAFNGMSIDEAGRQFLIDLAIDGVLVGFSFLRFGRFFARGGAAAEEAVKPISKWRFFIESPFKSPKGSWVTNIDDILYGIRKTPGISGQTRLLEIGKEFLENGALEFSRWVQVSVRSIDGGSIGHLGSALLGVTSPTPPPASTQTKSTDDVSSASGNGSGWTPSILGPTFLDDLFASAGKKDKDRSRPGTPPGQPPVNPAMAAPSAAASSDDGSGKPGDSGGDSGGPTIDFGSGGVNSYQAQTLRDDKDNLTKQTQQTTDLVGQTQLAAAGLQERSDKLRDLLTQDRPDSLEKNREGFRNAVADLEKRLVALSEAEKVLQASIMKADADLASLKGNGGELASQLEQSRTLALQEVKSTKEAIEQTRDLLNNLKASVANAESHAQAVAQARADAQRQALENALAQGRELWNQAQNALSVAQTQMMALGQSAQDKLQASIAQAQGVVTGLANHLSSAIADAQATQAALAAEAERARQSDAQRQANQARIDQLQQQLTGMLNVVEQSVTQLKQEVEQAKKTASETVEIVLNLVEEAANRVTTALEQQARAEQERQERQRQAQEMYDSVVNAGQRATEYLLSLAKPETQERQQLPATATLEALMNLLPSETRHQVEEARKFIAEQVITAGERLEELVRNGQRLQAQAQEKIAEAKREELRQIIDTVVRDGQRIGTEVLQGIQRVSVELSAARAEQEEISRQARGAVQERRDALMSVFQEARSLLGEMSKAELETRGAATRGETAAPGKTEDSRTLPQRAEAVLQRMAAEVVAANIPPRIASNFTPELRGEWERSQQIAASVLAALHESAGYGSAGSSGSGGAMGGGRGGSADRGRGGSAGGGAGAGGGEPPSTGGNGPGGAPSLPPERRAEIRESLERSVAVADRMCVEMAAAIQRESGRREVEYANSTRALSELSSYATESADLVKRAAQATLARTVDGVLRSSASRDVPAVSEVRSPVDASSVVYANTVMRGVAEAQARVAQFGAVNSVPRMRDSGNEPDMERALGNEDRSVAGMTSDEEIAQADTRGRHRKGKRSAQEAAKLADERRIIIQQLMTSIFEKSKREKLLRLLIELGISEVEYRDLVAKLGEMEARHAAEQVKEESVKQAIEVPVEASRDTDTKPTEVPAMKVGAPKVNPTTVVPVTSETRAEMYARLKKMKERSSL